MKLFVRELKRWYAILCDPSLRNAVTVTTLAAWLPTWMLGWIDVTEARPIWAEPGVRIGVWYLLFSVGLLVAGKKHFANGAERLRFVVVHVVTGVVLGALAALLVSYMISKY